MTIDHGAYVDAATGRFWVRRRADRGSRLAVWLHGGPGDAISDFAHAFDEPLLRRGFKLAYPDQRGAGRSLCGGAQTVEMTQEALVGEFAAMTIAQHVDDALAVVEALHAEERLSRSLLIGHSWGTFLAAQCAQMRPDLFTGVVLVGLDAHPGEAERLSHEALRRPGLLPAEALPILDGLGAPPYRTVIDIALKRALLDMAGREFFDAAGRERANAARVALQKSDPETALRRLLGLVLSADKLSDPVATEINLLSQVNALQLPVLVAQGRKDMNAGLGAERAWFDALSAPIGKNLIYFENSAHHPHWEEPEAFATAIATFADQAEAMR